MKKIAIVSLVLFLVTTATYANDIDQKYGLGVNFGVMKFVGGDHDYSNVDQNFGLWFRHGLTSKWSFEAAFRSGYVRPGSPMAGEDAGLTFNSTHAFYTTTSHGTLGARYHFSPDNSLSPYFGLHAGFIDWTVRDENGNDDVRFIPDGDPVYGYAESGRSNYLSASHLTLGASLGVEYFFSDGVSLDLAARYSYLLDNELDNIGMSAVWGSDNVDANSGLVEMFMGVTVYFGGDQDKDNDGILNEDDACPEVAEDLDGYKDEDGCPELDNDGDGLHDDCDKCPDQPEDQDGFQDEDGCPDPDNDNDGVIDAHDNCPDVAEDLDGFQDSDGCPDPDNDGDGVIDAADKCPDTPKGVAVENDGCPVAAVLKAEVILEGVTFASGKAELISSSFVILDRIVESALAYPEVTFEIQGHTDNTGSANLNRNLSQERANSVQAYLEMKGISAERMTAVGYGEGTPIATNATAEGRAINRRVELVRTDSN
ncbi:MAG: OmpA family protein [bacterium]|nr:OmpA family protein [bacterium]